MGDGSFNRARPASGLPRVWRKIPDASGGSYRSSGPGHIDVARGAPIARRNLVDQHVGRRIRRPLLDADDDIMDSPDDLTPLIGRENAFRHIDLGNGHERLLPCFYTLLWYASYC